MIPKRIFGKCPVCGNDGTDSDTAESGCDAGGSYTDDLGVSQSRPSSGNGIKLLKFRGETMCWLCKQEILEREAGDREAELSAEQESFRTRVGFSNTIT